MANNFDESLFKNNENIVCAENNNDFIIGLRNIIFNEFRKYISDNSFKKYSEKINVDKTIKQNIESIKNIL